MNNKGFTLIELIVTIGILSISIVPLSSMFIQSARVNSMIAEEYDATLVAQHYFEEIESVVDATDAANNGYSHGISTGIFKKDVIDGEFDVAITLVPVSGTENKNTINTFESLTDECNILITFDESNNTITVKYDDLAISNVNSGLSQTINSEVTNDVELLFNNSDDKFYVDVGTSSMLPVDVTGYSFFNVGIQVSHDVKLIVTNKLEEIGKAGEIVLYPVVDYEDEHSLTIYGEEGRITQKMNLYEGNITKSSESILYDVKIVVSRNGEEVTTFSGKKAFDE